MMTRRWKVFKIYLQRFFTLLMSCFRKMRTRIRRLRRSFERGSCSGQAGAKRKPHMTLGTMRMQPLQLQHGARQRPHPAMRR